MQLIGDLFKGAIILSIIALAQMGFSVKKVADKAVKAHKKGLTSYGSYSRYLTTKDKPRSE